MYLPKPLCYEVLNKTLLPLSYPSNTDFCKVDIWSTWLPQHVVGYKTAKSKIIQFIAPKLMEKCN